MLSSKFGKEVANYFSGEFCPYGRSLFELIARGSPLNRVSFLRTNSQFLSAALKHSSTKFLLFDNLAPLAKDPTKLEYATLQDVEPLLGESPYSKTEQELISSYNSAKTTPQLLFLGLNEHQKSGFEWHIYRGSPYFALDVTPKGTHAAQAESVIDAMKSQGHQFVQGRMQMSLPAKQAAIYAQARALLDWNARNPFCAQCGQPYVCCKLFYASRFLLEGFCLYFRLCYLACDQCNSVHI